jgi:hypothetical protein
VVGFLWLNSGRIVGGAGCSGSVHDCSTRGNGHEEAREGT